MGFFAALPATIEDTSMHLKISWQHAAPKSPSVGVTSSLLVRIFRPCVSAKIATGICCSRAASRKRVVRLMTRMRAVRKIKAGHIHAFADELIQAAGEATAGPIVQTILTDVQVIFMRPKRGT